MSHFIIQYFLIILIELITYYNLHGTQYRVHNSYFTKYSYNSIDSTSELKFTINKKEKLSFIFEKKIVLQ